VNPAYRQAHCATIIKQAPDKIRALFHTSAGFIRTFSSLYHLKKSPAKTYTIGRQELTKEYFFHAFWHALCYNFHCIDASVSGYARKYLICKVVILDQTMFHNAIGFSASLGRFALVVGGRLLLP
jgi:hypothetical protein